MRHLQVGLEQVVYGAKIGTGEHGNVFLGELVQGGAKETVAIKMVRPLGYFDGRERSKLVRHLLSTGTRTNHSSLAQDFLQHLRLWAELNSPYILPLRAFCIDPEERVFWLISPYLGKGDIVNLIKNEDVDVHKKMQYVSIY